MSPFSARTAEAFLHARLEGTGVQFANDEIQALIRQSNGNPVRLQRGAAELFDRYRGIEPHA
ncbi:MAG: hypothetical protein HC828_16585 [Blastochloris sp.]|nr:hypothetical protein [Blastochloris sp.]